MKKQNNILLIALLLLAGCSSQRVVSPVETPSAPVPQQKTHTVSVPAARASLSYDNRTMSSRVAFSTTVDSLVIWSIQPIAGIELLRLEATPDDLVIFDKTTMEYIPLTYDDLLSYSPTPITFQTIQEIATGAILPRGQQNTLRSFTVGQMTVILDIYYPEIRTNVPVNMTRMSVGRFKYKSLEQVLQ